MVVNIGLIGAKSLRGSFFSFVKGPRPPKTFIVH